MRRKGFGACGLQTPPDREGISALELNGAAADEVGFEFRGREVGMRACGGELGEEEASSCTDSAGGLENERKELCAFLMREIGEFSRLCSLSMPSGPK